MIEVARTYLDDHYVKDPLVSPVFGNFAGFPPLLFHVGETEILLDDTLRCVARARDSNVETHLRLWPYLPHVFHAFSSRLPLRARALREVGDFVVAKLTASAMRK